MRHLVWLLILGSSPAWALSEEDYAAQRSALAQPYYFNNRRMETVDGVKGVALSSVSFPSSNNDVAVIILGGRTEAHIKYAEVFYDLRDWGYSLYSYDHRGQGFSERILKDNIQKQHVDSFDDYVEDLRRYVDGVVRRNNHRKVFILAHSMGGLVATRYAQQYPRGVDGLVLSSPMHRFYTRPFPEPVAYGLGWYGVLTLQGDAYGLSQGDRGPSDFDTNRVTRSRARFEFNEGLLEENPGLKMGGVTYQWVQQAFGAASAARGDAEKLQAPVLLFQSGDDRVVRNDGQDTVCQGARDCRSVLMDGARHELMMETDATRNAVLEQAHAFFEEQRNAPPWEEQAAGCNSMSRPDGVVLGLVLLALGRRRVGRAPAA